MIHGLTHEQMYPVKYVGIPKWMCPGPTARQLSPLAKLLREIAQKKKEENQRNYRNEQFDLIPVLGSHLLAYQLRSYHARH